VRFEDDSVEAAKVVKQWNVKIISVSLGLKLVYSWVQSVPMLQC
jgi:hypothetical protein